MISVRTTLALSIAMLGAPALAQDAQTTCARMQAEGRLGQLTLAQCACRYRVAEQELDADVRALLFDAWRTGNNNMAKLGALRPRSRIEKQFRSMERALKTQCQ